MDAEVLFQHGRGVRRARLYISATLSILLAVVGTIYGVWFVTAIFVSASALLVPFALGRARVIVDWANVRPRRLLEGPRLPRISIAVLAMVAWLGLTWYLGARLGAGAAWFGGVPLVLTEAYLGCIIAHSRDSRS